MDSLRIQRGFSPSCAGRTGEPFNENVAQVKRLISRDRKEFMGNSEDILDKYTTEFGDGEGPSPASTSDSAAREVGEVPCNHAG